jgi:hypothetical protein
MRTGRILDNVGFRSTEGVIRRLTIRERLLQIQMSKRSGELNHPIHGKILVDISKVADLLSKQEGELHRYKRLMFEI